MTVCIQQGQVCIEADLDFKLHRQGAAVLFVLQSVCRHNEAASSKEAMLMMLQLSVSLLQALPRCSELTDVIKLHAECTPSGNEACPLALVQPLVCTRHEHGARKLASAPRLGCLHVCKQRVDIFRSGLPSDARRCVHRSLGLLAARAGAISLHGSIPSRDSGLNA